MSLREYYSEAISRAFWTGIAWMLGQGWLLSLLLAVGVFVCAGVFAGLRAYRGHHSWQEAMNTLWSAVGEFLLAFVGGTAFVVFGLFCWFFVNDAPDQLNGVKQDAADKISDANSRIAQLQTQVDLLNKQLAARDAVGLFVECHFSPMPNKMPPAGRYYAVDIFNPSQPAVMGEFFGNPGADVPPMTNLGGVQCTTTNYTNEVLASVVTGAIVDYIKAEKTDSGNIQGRGAGYQSKAVDGVIPKIDIGSDKAFTLWFANLSDDFIAIRFAATTKAKKIDGTEIVVPISYAGGYTTMSPKIPDK